MVDAPPTLSDILRHRYRLAAHCRACGRQKVLPCTLLARTYGGDMSIDAIGPRLKCTRCGARAGAIQIMVRW